MSNDNFPTGPANIRAFMASSNYAKVIYSPIVSNRRDPFDENGMGRSDYGLNKYFRGPNNGCRRFDAQPGKVEPMIVPIQNPSNPSVWNTDLGTTAKHAAYWYINDRKTPGLYIDGSVRMFSIAEGSSFDSKVSDDSEFE
jgi:hypothetical protein